MFARLPSSPTRHGELTKGKIGREACLLATSTPKKKIGKSMVLLAMASEVTWEASKGGLASPGWRGTNPMVKKPLLAMASKKNSRGELMQMRNLINRALDHFSRDAFYSDRKIYLEIEREREIGLGLHRVRVIEVLILPYLVRNHKVVLNLFLSIHSCKASMTMRS